MKDLEAWKLTWSKVRDIRSRWGKQGVTQTSLAAEYGVTSVTIGNVVNFKTWKGI